MSRPLLATQNKVVTCPEGHTFTTNASRLATCPECRRRVRMDTLNHRTVGIPVDDHTAALMEAQEITRAVGGLDDLPDVLNDAEWRQKVLRDTPAEEPESTVPIHEFLKTDTRIKSSLQAFLPLLKVGGQPIIDAEELNDIMEEIGDAMASTTARVNPKKVYKMFEVIARIAAIGAPLLMRAIAQRKAQKDAEKTLAAPPVDLKPAGPVVLHASLLPGEK